MDSTEQNSQQVIVIHPGSQYVRIGRASDSFPLTLFHCIARRRKMPQSHRISRRSWIANSQLKQEDQRDTSSFEDFSAAQEALAGRPMLDGKFREVTTFEQLTAMNRACRAQKSETMLSSDWTKVQNLPEFLIGQEAMMIAPDEPYDLYWPISRGRLNTHDGIGGSITAVLQDLRAIWVTALENYLDIKAEQLKHYNAILIIPDSYRRAHVREMMNLLLNDIGFQSACVVLESVCATFGAGLASACVVDAGDQTSTVCCVEDGLCHRPSRITLDLGGSGITRCLETLLRHSGFPYRQCDSGRIVDAMMLQDIKETCCHLDQDIHGIQRHNVLLRHPGRPIICYPLTMGDERILAPLSLFFPSSILRNITPNYVRKQAEKYTSDPSDYLDENYLIETTLKPEKTAKQKRRNDDLVASADGAKNCDKSRVILDNDNDSMDHQSVILDSRTKRDYDELNDDTKDLDSDDQLESDDGHALAGLHEAICRSIESCNSEETRQRMYSSILLVGGGLMFPGVDSWLRYLVWGSIPQASRRNLRTIEVISKPRDDLDQRVTVWTGAAILAKLESVQELWIGPNEWNKFGVRILREKASFIW